MKNNISVLNVRLPDESIRWIDALIEKGLYPNRSEAIRDIIREEILHC